MAVCADQGVGVGDPILQHRDLGQILKVDLVDDAGPGRDHPEIVKGVLAPARERIALAVPFELLFEILPIRVAGAKKVDLDRVVDDHVDGHEGIDLARIDAQARERRAHRGEVDKTGHTAEVLQNDPGGFERKLVTPRVLGVPAGKARHIRFGDFETVALAEGLFEHDLDAEGQPGDVTDPGAVQVVEPIHFGNAAARFKAGERAGHVLRCHKSVPLSP